MISNEILLINKNVKLTILRPEHFALLEPLANDKGIWEFNPSFSDPTDFKMKWFEKAMTHMQTDRRIAFYIEYQKQPVGSSSYYDLEKQQLNIGYTWFSPRFWGTGINRIVKFLMLEHAFEKMKMENVYFKIDSINHRSYTAVEKLGAKNIKVIESDLIMPSGRVRDTKVYAINKNEWPFIKEKLESKIKELV